ALELGSSAAPLHRSRARLVGTPSTHSDPLRARSGTRCLGHYFPGLVVRPIRGFGCHVDVHPCAQQIRSSDVVEYPGEGTLPPIEPAAAGPCPGAALQLHGGRCDLHNGCPARVASGTLSCCVGPYARLAVVHSGGDIRWVCPIVGRSRTLVARCAARGAPRCQLRVAPLPQHSGLTMSRAATRVDARRLPFHPWSKSSEPTSPPYESTPSSTPPTPR